MKNTAALAVMGVLSFASSAQAMVYGLDDRRDDFATLAEWKKLGDSVALITEAEFLQPASDVSYRLQGKRSIDLHKICSDQRFAQQSVFGSCSGFLIAPQLLMTAGHCIQGGRISEPQGYESSDYADQRIVFGVKHDRAETANKQQFLIPKSHVYTIKRVIRQSSIRAFRDFAIVELDRPVPAQVAEPLKLAPNDSLQAGDGLMLIGHPLGLARKYSGSARVVQTFDQVYSSDLDAFVGNPGSPVFSTKNGLVVGILNTTQPDAFAIRESQDCAVYRQMSQKLGSPSRGAMIQKINTVNVNPQTPDQVLMNETLVRLEYLQQAYDFQYDNVKRQKYLQKALDIAPVVAALDAGAQINLTDIHGYTLLTQVVGERHYGLTDLFLSRGADLNQMSPDRVNPVTAAVMSSSVVMVRKIAARGPRLDLIMFENITIEEWLRTTRKYYLPLFPELTSGK